MLCGGYFGYVVVLISECLGDVLLKWLGNALVKVLDTFG